MPRSVEAYDGEVLDALVWRATGSGAAALEAVLAVNPGLAAHGRALPAGVQVIIPDTAEAPASAPMLQLWD